MQQEVDFRFWPPCHSSHFWDVARKSRSSILSESVVPRTPCASLAVLSPKPAKRWWNLVGDSAPSRREEQFVNPGVSARNRLRFSYHRGESFTKARQSQGTLLQPASSSRCCPARRVHRISFLSNSKLAPRATSSHIQAS